MAYSKTQKALPIIHLILIWAACTPGIACAGTFMFAGEDSPNRITHPSGYAGTGGELNIEVCIDATAADAGDMEISIKNIVGQINGMTAATPNLFFGEQNNIPSNAIDFESLVLHELGHCTGLAHPNLGSQTGVSGSDTEYTKTGDGANDAFSFDSGADTVIGSKDDQRDDDQNLHWFRKGVNNPFLEVATPEKSNYSRNVADLPPGDDFVANAGRDVGTLLGFADTESVMQQGQYYDEDQRWLQADDVATYKMGMTGLDEIASTADDYTIKMVYGGIKVDTSNCDIVIQSTTSGFGSCSISASSSNGIHFRITSATFSYNSDFIWHFNDVLNSNCSAADDDLVISNVTHDNTQNHKACNSITYGPNYTVGPSGVVTATAPSITLGPNTTINGVFTAIISIP
jgi:hypothetical protein